MPSEQPSRRPVGGDLMNYAVLFLALSMVSAPTLTLAQDACPFLPAFKKLATQLDSMPPQAAVLALEKYLVENDNPHARGQA